MSAQAFSLRITFEHRTKSPRSKVIPVSHELYDGHEEIHARNFASDTLSWLFSRSAGRYPRDGDEMTITMEAK